MKKLMIVVAVMCCMTLNACSGGQVSLSDKFGAVAEEKSGFLGTLEIKDSSGNVLINTEDLLSIDTISEKDSSGTYGIEIKLTETGADKFRDATQENLGGALDIYVNGTVVSSPTVESIIMNGEIQINGFDALLDAYSIVSAVKSGGKIEGNTYETETAQETEEMQETVTTAEQLYSEPEQTEEPQEVPHREGMYGISDKDVYYIGSPSIFERNDVRNDVTGNWKISIIAEDVQMVDYALSYYEKYFWSNDEVHAIVNFNYNTTTCITTDGFILYVDVHEYVDGEEHDANLLFSGMLLKQYFVYLDNGDIEEIQ